MTAPATYAGSPALRVEDLVRELQRGHAGLTAVRVRRSTGELWLDVGPDLDVAVLDVVRPYVQAGYDVRFVAGGNEYRLGRGYTLARLSHADAAAVQGLDVGAAASVTSSDPRTARGATGLAVERWTRLGRDVPALATYAGKVRDGLGALPPAPDGYPALEYALDAAVRLSAEPGATPELVEQMTQWADDRRYKTEAAGMRWPAGTPPPWSATFDPMMPPETRPPPAWFARNLAWFLTLPGNPDTLANPSLYPRLAGVARQIVDSKWALNHGPYSSTDVGNLYGWVLSILPPEAVKTADWIKKAHKINEYHPPTLADAAEDVGRRVKEDLTPPGGFALWGGGLATVATIVAVLYVGHTYLPKPPKMPRIPPSRPEAHT